MRSRWTWVVLVVGVLLVCLGGLLITACLSTQPAGSSDELVPRPTPGTITLRVGGKPLKIHALPTGTIQIKRCHHHNCLDESAPYPLRFVRILLDRSFAKPLPIWTYLIEHPEGRFLVDTGGDTKWRDPKSWSCNPRVGRVARSMARVYVKPHETILARLAALQLKPKDIKAVMITHTHFDHTAGIRPLGRKTYVGQGDLDAAARIGSAPCRFFAGAKLTSVEPLLKSLRARKGDLADKLFGASLPLTQDGRVRIYSTPGHTPGSLTMRVISDQGELWFVGDTTFTQSGIKEGAQTASIHTGMKQVRTQHAAYRELRQKGRVWLFPAHDHNTKKRLLSINKRLKR